MLKIGLAQASYFALIAGFSQITLSAAEPSFYRDVRPILQRNCQGCHQPNVKTSSYDLTTFAGLVAGGKRGIAVKPGMAGDSLLVKYLTGEVKPQMPIGQPPLPAEQIELVRSWIASGAKDDSPAEAIEKPVTYAQPPVLTAIAFSPDGATLAVSGYREILLIPAEGTAPTKRLPGLSERIQSLSFSTDGSLLVAGGGTPARFGEIQFWDPRSAKMLHSVSLTGDTVFGASLSPDATKVAVGCTDNSVRILNASTGKELQKIGNHENWVLGTIFGTDSKRIVSVGRDRAAKLTDATSGAFLENVNLLRGELTAIARHPAKDIVVVAGEDRIPYVYQMDRPKNMRIADDTTQMLKLERQQGLVTALAWSADAKQIAVAGLSPEVTIYDAESGVRLLALTGHSAGIYTLSYAPDSKRIATGGFDGQVRIYDTVSGTLIRAFVPVPIDLAKVSQ